MDITKEFRMDIPYDIDSIVYIIEKKSQENEYPKYNITKCVVNGYYNYGHGWKIHLKTNRNKYKYIEYNVALCEVNYTVFKSKKEAKDRIKELGGIVID